MDENKKKKKNREKKYLTNWKLKLKVKEMIKFIGALSSKFFNFFKYAFDFLGDHIQNLVRQRHGICIIWNEMNN